MAGGWATRIGRSIRRPHRASTYFFAVVIAVSAAGSLHLWRREAERHTAFVVGTDLPAYHQLRPDDLREVRVPRNRLPDRSVKNRAELTGRYVVLAVRRGGVISLNDLGPSLPPGTLSSRLLVALPANVADVGGGMVSRGNRVDLLLSSTAAESPRNAALRDVVVLDVKSLPGQAGNYMVVYAVRRGDEPGLLSAGGTARVFIVRNS